MDSQAPLVREEYNPLRRISYNPFGEICCVSSARKSQALNNLQVFFEIFVVMGVKQYPSLKTFAGDLLQGYRRTGHILGKVFPGSLIMAKVIFEISAKIFLS